MAEPGHPDGTKPIGKRPMRTRRFRKRLMRKPPVGRQPAAPQPADQQPAAPQPAAPQPADQQPAAPQPADQQPAAPQPDNQWALARHLYDSLGKWGPVLLAIVGIGGSAYFLQEQKTARQDKIEERLDDATSELLDMSGTLIENTKEVMDLRDEITTKIKKERKEFDDEINAKRKEISTKESLLATKSAMLAEEEKKNKMLSENVAKKQAELAAQSKQLDKARRKSEELSQDVAKKQTELADQREQLLAQRARLDKALRESEELSQDVARKQAELDARLDELGRQEELAVRRRREQKEKSDDLAAEVAKLREEREVLLKRVKSLQQSPGSATGRAPASVVEVEKIAEEAKLRPAELLAEYRSSWNKDDGRAVAKKLTALVGLTEEELRPVIAEGAGFDLWVRAVLPSESPLYFGIAEQQGTYYGGALAILTSEGKVVGTSAMFGRHVLTKIPDQDNWDDWWMASLSSTELDGELVVDPDYVPYTGGTISVARLIKEFNDPETKVEIVHGRDRPVSVLDLEGLRVDFPDIYEVWKEQEDYRGRPKANLAMIERAAGFEAGDVTDDVDFRSLPLSDRFEELVTAAVTRDRGDLARLLSPALESEVLGEIAAVVLSERFRIRAVEHDAEGLKAQGSEPSPTAVVEAEYLEKLRENRVVTVFFHFEKPYGSDDWRLFRFSKRVATAEN